eukprot:CAMPEP_0173173664 /NCGR_PEP_ID=MMETSP1141-20130122/2950_1 /TAXON_ID=483371 /ORGANISM="non described non described, Strain CCMP2298" /LENGTH=57 /DNA_ID=CAMNT_0014095757 /DNA_START=96 /DNA_END=269 /DNA_ORIENTATION=-
MSSSPKHSSCPNTGTPSTSPAIFASRAALVGRFLPMSNTQAGYSASSLINGACSSAI